MYKNEKLGDALHRVGDSDQISICTQAVLDLTQTECKLLLEGHEVGINNDDRISFNQLCVTRISKGQSILPWANLELDWPEVQIVPVW